MPVLVFICKLVLIQYNTYNTICQLLHHIVVFAQKYIFVAIFRVAFRYANPARLQLISPHRYAVIRKARLFICVGRHPLAKSYVPQTMSMFTRCNRAKNVAVLALPSVFRQARRLSCVSESTCSELMEILPHRQTFVVHTTSPSWSVAHHLSVFLPNVSAQPHARTLRFGA